MTKEEFAEWKNNPVTKEVMGQVQREILMRLDAFAGAGTLKDSADETAMITARLVGIIEGLRMVRDIDFDDTQEESA